MGVEGAYAGGRPVYFVDGGRTPFLKARGTPGPFHSADLAVAAGKALLARQPFEPGDLDEVVFGCIIPGPDELNIARIIALRLGCGKAMPAWTVQRNCGSGMQAIDCAAQAIAHGRAELVLAGGTEAMSQAPVLVGDAMVKVLADLAKARSAWDKLRVLGRLRPGHFVPVIGLLRGLSDPISGLNMGQTAEGLAARFGITRERMDGFALESHRRLARAQDGGWLEEVAPLFGLDGTVYERDEGLRRDADLPALAKLKPAFEPPYGLVTAGNSAQITDGAACLLLASADAVRKHGLDVLGRVEDCQWAGLEPSQMGLGPVHAMAPIMERQGLESAQVDYWEINEAFAAQVLACTEAWQSASYCREELGLEAPFQAIAPDRLNVDGGAVAIGHPVGCSGARIVLHLLHVLRRNDAALGMASMCIGGGQGGAMLIRSMDGLGGKGMLDLVEQARHWRLELDGDGILWLTLDRAGSPINALSSEVLAELEGMLPDIQGMPAKGLVIRSSKAGFIAGADVGEFTALTGPEQALAHIQRGQEIFRRLELLPMPTVAMIHGFCLGGGLELALACTRRVASDDPGTRLGLPEVQLGIHPGFGGTVRLTALLGPWAAMDLMLTGRAVSARAARKLGLVDTVVPERHLVRAAIAAVQAGKARKASWIRQLPGFWPLKPALAWLLRRKVAERANPEHYPAPFALIDLWSRHGGNPGAMYQAEAASVARLVTGPTARNLVRVFQLQEKLKALARTGASPARTVHVVGGGAMGGDIAAWCALQGLGVTVQDVDAGRLAQVVKRAAQLFRRKLKEPRLVQAALDRLVPDPRGVGAARADLVIEAIFEDIDAKTTLYRYLEPRMKPDAILATNTSSIPLEQLAAGLARPERFVGLHFFNPVPKMQLVEVVTMAGTAPDVADRATAFVAALRKLPLPVKSSPGFLVNRILMPYLMEALTLVEEGVSPAEIDRAALGFGMPMGPVLLADTVGLDICLSVAGVLSGHSGGAVPRRLKEMVSAGHLGKKTGLGFYRYRDGKPEIPKGPQPAPGAVIEQRLMLRLVNEAVACLRERVTRDEDLLDAGVVFGTGFAPFRGGPLCYNRQEGINHHEKQLKSLEDQYGNRFAPDPGWSSL